MNRTLNRLKYIFLGVFLAATLGVVIWQIGWAIPAKRCTDDKKWWDYYERVCAQPVMISDITGRTIQDKQAEAAAKAALGRPAASAP